MKKKRGRKNDWRLPQCHQEQNQFDTSMMVLNSWSWNRSSVLVSSSLVVYNRIHSDVWKSTKASKFFPVFYSQEIAWFNALKMSRSMFINKESNLKQSLIYSSLGPYVPVSTILSTYSFLSGVFFLPVDKYIILLLFSNYFFLNVQHRKYLLCKKNC